MFVIRNFRNQTSHYEFLNDILDYNYTLNDTLPEQLYTVH